MSEVGLQRIAETEAAERIDRRNRRMVQLRDAIDATVDTDPLKLRDALYAVLDRLDAEADGARRQMEAGDYRLCPPDMLRIYCHEAIEGALT